MKKYIVFLVLSLSSFTCGPLPPDCMSGRWFVKNQTAVNLKMSCLKGKPLQLVNSFLIEPGDSVVICSAVGNTYMTPSFDAFQNIDCIFLSIDGGQSEGKDAKIWRREDDEEEHDIFNELSWSRYNKGFGLDAWVFNITDQDISSLK